MPSRLRPTAALVVTVPAAVVLPAAVEPAVVAAEMTAEEAVEPVKPRVGNISVRLV